MAQTTGKGDTGKAAGQTKAEPEAAASVPQPVLLSAPIVFTRKKKRKYTRGTKDA